MVELEQVTDEKDIAFLKAHIEEHVEVTGSPKAQALLDRWDESLKKFVKVFPHEYRRALAEMAKKNEQEAVHG